MTVTDERDHRDGRGIACHCGDDPAGHVPGTRGCEPVKVGKAAPSRSHGHGTVPHPTTLAADTFGALAKSTRDRDYARRLRASAAILREARKERYR